MTFTYDLEPLVGDGQYGRNARVVAIVQPIGNVLPPVQLPFFHALQFVPYDLLVGARVEVGLQVRTSGHHRNVRVRDPVVLKNDGPDDLSHTVIRGDYDVDLQRQKLDFTETIYFKVLMSMKELERDIPSRIACCPLESKRSE